MREGIHPNYIEATVVCACGNTFKTRSTKASIRLEICSNCHPFFTGRQKFVDSAGRVERFQKRFANVAVEAAKKPTTAKLVKGQPKAMSKKKGKILSSAPIRTKPLSTSKAPRPAAGAPPKEPPTKAH